MATAVKTINTYHGKCFDCNDKLPTMLVTSPNGVKYGICGGCVGHYHEEDHNGWVVEPLKPVDGIITGSNSPYSGQKPDMIIPAKEIPEFCEYCEGTSHQKPPKYLVVAKPPSNNSRYLCDDCIKNSGASWIKNATITPLGEESVSEKPQFMCNVLWSDIHENGAGGTQSWGQCSGNAEFLVMAKTMWEKSGNPVIEFSDPVKNSYPGPVASCKKHSTIWTNAGWIFKPISEVYGKNPVNEESPEYGQVQKYKTDEEHHEASKNMYICEKQYKTGFDGTTDHFGECYYLTNENAKPPYHYACDNHAGKYVADGFLVCQYGQKNTVNIDPPAIPDCLLPYIPNYTIDNCWFRVHLKENFDWSGFNTKYGVSGWCNGPQVGTMGGDVVCKTHYEFVEKMNQFGIFAKLIPLKVQKMEIPELVCKIKWNETSNKGGMTTLTQGECSGAWYVVTKPAITPSFSFNYGDYECFPVCEHHKEIFSGMTFTPVNDIANGKIKVSKTKKPVKPKPPVGYTVRTQKAKGLQALKDTYFPVPDFQIYDVKETKPDVLVGKFVRPCPMRPRHGFVDSRTVSSREDAEKIIKETLAADPDAEFLLMDYVPAPFSGIWTPGYLAIGTGTDGATAGKTAITIPIMGDFLAKFGSSSSPKSKAGIESAPYVEILWRKTPGYTDGQYQGLTVQLRDGPKLPEGAEDYIPSEFTVEHIILADGDLLEWEDKMRHTPANSVVWHPNGTMASHYAIHAVLNKVPLLITREPKIGEVLKPTENGPSEVNIDLMRAGFQIACEMEINFQQAAYFMLLGCHQTGQWLGKYDILLGAAMGFSYRLAMTAALGEERHYDCSKSSKASRDGVYTKYWKKADTQYGRTKFMDALEKFLNGHLWPGSNYGGKAWYQFTSQAVVMYNSLIKKDHKTAMEAMNQLIHAAHNSGWGFNKFISQSEMTSTAKNPIYSGFHVGPYLYEVLTASNETVKSAARSFWKRKELELPVDKGTGIGKFKDSVGGHDEDEDHENCDGDCPVCFPKPPHLYSDTCTCEKCKVTKLQMGAKVPQTITQAHVKVYGKASKMMAHIQYKSANTPPGLYWTKDLPCPDPIWKMYQKLIGKYDGSYAGSGTQYIIMEKDSQGWGVLDPKTLEYYKLLDLEVTPNAS